MYQKCALSARLHTFEKSPKKFLEISKSPKGDEVLKKALAALKSPRFRTKVLHLAALCATVLEQSTNFLGAIDGHIYF